MISTVLTQTVPLRLSMICNYAIPPTSLNYVYFCHFLLPRICNLRVTGIFMGISTPYEFRSSVVQFIRVNAPFISSLAFPFLIPLL